MSESERRSTERLLLSIPIRVIAFGESDRSFSEDTHTIEVNRGGARIALKHRVAPDDTLRIINLENLREADFRVAGATRLASEEGGEWGVECLDVERNIWGIEFPAPLAWENQRAGALLECQGCRRQHLLILTLMEVDILDLTGTLPRLCDRCGQLSTWAYADVTRRPQDLPASEPAAPPRVDSSGRQIERRTHKRLGLKLPILVRNAQGEREIGKTENISKGGLAVCMNMKLVVGVIVTVVCPYTEGGQSIEQRAEVRRRVPIIEGKKWLYGLRYVF